MKRLIVLYVLTAASTALAQGTGNVLTLNRCLELAMKQSPLTKAYSAEWEAALIGAESDKPIALPKVYLIASGGIQGPGSKLDVPGMVETSGWVGIRLDQPLYRAGLSAARSRYLALRSVATANWQEEMSALTLTVTTDYNSMLQAQAGVAQAARGLSEAQQFLLVVKQQIAAGLGKPVDIGAANSAVAEAQAGLQRAKDGVLLARYNLNRQIGRPLSSPISGELTDVPDAVTTTTEQYVALALKQRPELALLSARIKEAAAGRTLASDQSMPQLSLRVEADEQTPTALQREHYAAVMVHFKWPLLDRGKAHRDAQVAALQVIRLKSLLSNAETGIELDVIHQSQLLDEARANLHTAVVSQDAAAAEERVALVSYQVGKGSAMDLQKALHTLWQSRDALEAASIAILNSVASLRHSAGQDVPNQGVAR
jgi:outer membrane protein TolC